MRSLYKSLTILFLSTIINLCSAATCTSTGNGAWNNAATWSCGHVPTCGDKVVIQAAHTVTINNQQDYSSCTSTLTIEIYGTLKFTNGNKLKLPCGSYLYIDTGASMIPGSGGGNSNYLEICSTIVWNAADGPVSGNSCFPPGCNPLPIELIAFTGELEQKIVFLNWKTGTETYNDYFDVERSSDALSFEKIATVPSKALNGTSQTVQEYQIIDHDLKSPIYYYRLKQVDKNKQFKYTPSISVKIYAAELNIFPNPSNGSFSIDVPTVEVNRELSIKIYSIQGQLVHESVQNIKNDIITGSRVDIVPSKPLPKGIYMTKIQFLGQTHQLKLIVQ